MGSWPAQSGAVLRGRARRLGRDSRCWVRGARRSGAGGRGQRQIFVLGLRAVSTETQYFGRGTRLTVLGKPGCAGAPGSAVGPGMAGLFLCCAGVL